MGGFLWLKSKLLELAAAYALSRVGYADYDKQWDWEYVKYIT